MAMSIVSVLLVLAAAGAGLSEAAVYKVGDATGWTILGSPNYTDWAISKTFHVGDSVVFEYNKNFHNVMEVSKADYKACSAASPIATYTSGNDSVALNRRGHHFFICGVSGHCSAGQKVDIRIPKLAASAPAAAPSDIAAPAALSPLPATGGGGVVSNPAAAPRPSGAAAAAPRGLALATALLCLAALSAGLMRQ